MQRDAVEIPVTGIGLGPRFSSTLLLSFKYSWWCCYSSNIAIKAMNNLLLLQIAHMPDSSFRTKLESGHSRPVEDS